MAEVGGLQQWHSIIRTKLQKKPPPEGLQQMTQLIMVYLEEKLSLFFKKKNQGFIEKKDNITLWYRVLILEIRCYY